MQKYKSHKIVEAMKIGAIEVIATTGGALLIPTHIGFDNIKVDRAYLLKHNPKSGGYYVRYPDGYESFSPAEAFECGHTAIDAKAPSPVAVVINNNQPGDAFIGQTPPHSTLDVGTKLYAKREEAITTGQQPITGYRNLSPDEVALINEVKALAERCGEYIAKLRGYPANALDQRWISIGATDLQRGFMAITLGIAQPTTF